MQFLLSLLEMEVEVINEVNLIPAFLAFVQQPLTLVLNRLLLVLQLLFQSLLSVELFLSDFLQRELHVTDEGVQFTFLLICAHSSHGTRVVEKRFLLLEKFVFLKVFNWSCLFLSGFVIRDRLGHNGLPRFLDTRLLSGFVELSLRIYLLDCEEILLLLPPLQVEFVLGLGVLIVFELDLICR